MIQRLDTYSIDTSYDTIELAGPSQQQMNIGARKQIDPARGHATIYSITDIFIIIAALLATTGSALASASSLLRPTFINLARKSSSDDVTQGIRQHSFIMSASKSNDATIAMHWFRKGLRLHDNAGLLHALSLAAKGGNNTDGKIYPVYIVDPNCYQLLKCSVNRAKFLLECVRDLDNSLRARGSRLYVATGDPIEVLPKLWSEWGVTHMTHDADETGEPYAVERDGAIQKVAKQIGVEMLAFQSETLRPLGNFPGGYIANLGGLASNAPSTMTSFQQLLSRIDRGNIPAPLVAPTTGDFPSHSATTADDKYLPLEHPWEIPWPRGYTRDEIGPVWDRKDCLNASLRPIVSGGETIALQRLEQVVSARPDW
jgi:hypothetical protein